MAVTWPESCRTGTAGSPAAWLQTTSKPLARLVWLLNLSSFLGGGGCEQNMMSLILADMPYLCCISRVLFAFKWYPGSCQRPVKAILTPAYTTTTTLGKRNRTSKDNSLLHYHFLSSGRISAASLQGEETKEVDNIHPLQLHVCMREREHLWGAQCGLIPVFSLSQSTCIYFPHVMELFVRQNNHKTQFFILRVVRLLENRTSKPTER